MFKIGEMADHAMASDFVRKMRQQGLSCELILNNETKMAEIWVGKEEDIPKVFEQYRLMVGIPRPIEIDQEWLKIKTVPFGQMTKQLIFSCVAVFIFMIMSKDRAIPDFLFFSANHEALFSEILNGQVWRLITPIFLHFGFLHIIFNMLWMKDLGSMIEHTEGTKFFLILVFVSGLCSNIAQYLVRGPQFGGMSGVVFALLGFLWMIKRFNPNFEFSLPRRDVSLMVGWFIVCMTGLFGPIANMAHGVGLSVGMIFGIVEGIKETGGVNSKDLIRYSFYAIALSVLATLVEYYKMGQVFYFQNPMALH